MAFNVGAIVGHLSLDKKKWSASIKSVQKDQKTLGGWVKKNSAQFKKLGMAIAGVGIAVVAGFGKIIKETAKTGDEIAKLSKKVGVSTELLSGYKLAVEHGGSSLAGFGKALGRLSRVIADADRGLVTYQRTFQDLGIEIRTSDGNLKSMEAVMLEVSDKFAKMEDGTKKTSLAMELFGRSGMELIPMLNMGAEGLRKEREEAERLGLVFSEKSAKASEEFNDRLHDLKMSLAGVGKSMALEVMPVLTKFFEMTRDEIVDTQDTGKLFAQNFLGFFKVIAWGIHGLLLAWHALQAGVFKVASYVAEKLRGFVAVILAQLVVLEKLPIVGKKIIPITDAVAEAFESLDAIAKGYNETAEEQIKIMGDIIIGFENIETVLDRIKTKVSEEPTVTGEELVETILPAPGKVADILSAIREQYKQTGNVIKEESDGMEMRMDTLGLAWDSAVANMTSALTTWGENTKNLFKGVAGIVGNFVKSMIVNLGKMIIAEQMASVKTWVLKKTEAIASGIASVFKSIPFPLNIAVAGTVVGLVTALFAKIAKFKEGGIAMTTMPAVVGERPEAIIPLEDLPKILSRMTEGSSVGGPHVEMYNTMQINALDALSFRDFVRGNGGDEIIEWLSTQARNRLIEALRR